MAEIVNLRALRQRKARAEAARRAAGNRARSRLREARFGARSKFGRPEAEREKVLSEAERAGRALGGLRLEREEG